MEEFLQRARSKLEQPAYVGIYTYELRLEPEITFEIRLPINMLLLYDILFDWS